MIINNIFNKYTNPAHLLAGTRNIKFPRATREEPFFFFFSILPNHFPMVRAKKQSTPEEERLVSKFFNEGNC